MASFSGDNNPLDFAHILSFCNSIILHNNLEHHGKEIESKLGRTCLSVSDKVYISWGLGINPCISLFSAAATEYHRLDNLYRKKKKRFIQLMILEAGKSQNMVPASGKGYAMVEVWKVEVNPQDREWWLNFLL